MLVIHAMRLQLAMHQSVDQSFASLSVIWNHEKQRLGAIFNLIWLQTLQWKQTAPYKATRVPYSLFQTNIITSNERSFVYQRSVKRDFMALNHIVNKLGFHYVHSVKQLRYILSLHSCPWKISGHAYFICSLTFLQACQIWPLTTVGKILMIVYLNSCQNLI